MNLHFAKVVHFPLVYLFQANRLDFVGLVGSTRRSRYAFLSLRDNNTVNSYQAWKVGEFSVSPALLV
jgi:hypothetical protein